MFKVPLSFILISLNFVKPQDLNSNRVVAEREEKFGFAQIVPESAPEIISKHVSYGYAVDFSMPGNLNLMKCLKSSHYNAVFVRAFNPSGAGSFDPNCVATIRNAYSAGLGIEIYMTPQPHSSYQGYQQVDVLVDGLVKNGITLRSMWIQVTSPINWLSSGSQNINFINSMVSRAKQRGLTVGIYTNRYDWSQITGNWNTIGDDVLLWYWNVYGPGVAGETTPTFEDFRSFGSWKAPVVKQFAQSEIVCQLTVNREVFSTSVPEVSEKILKNNMGKIVVGSIGI